MALRGETVGTAYVRILADGTGLPKSIRDEMDDLDEVFDDAGAEHSKAYAKAWKKQSEQNTEMEKGLRKQIDKAFGKMQADAEALQNGLEDHIREGIVNGLKDGVNSSDADELGARVAKKMADGFSRTGVLPDNIRGEVDRALKDMEREAEEFEKNWRRDFDRIETDTVRTLTNVRRNLDTLPRTFENIRASVGRLGQSLERDFVSTWRSFSQREGPTAENRLSRLGDLIDRSGNKIGKVFGRGSRNDLLNFFGAFFQAPVEIIARLVGGLGDLVDLGGEMKTAFSGAGGGFSGLVASAKELGPVASNIFAVGAGIGGLVLIIGPVAGLISGIAGAIAALGAAVAFALGAGLGVLGGLLAPIAFGIGTVALAFAGLSDKMKKGLKEDLKGVIDQFHLLQEVAAGGIVKGITDSAKPIATAFKNLTPLIEDVSGAIGDVIANFAKAAGSPGFKKFITSMQETVPEAIRTMGDIAKNVFAGIGGLFQGLAPIAQDFLGWLAGVTQEFANWSNSVAGQADIKGFMEKASESAQELWGLLSAVGEALGKILFNEDARKGGGDLLKSMTDAVQDFITFLDENPDAIAQWIGDGVQIAKDLGGAIRSVLHFFDELDTPENRKAASEVIQLLTKGLDAASTAAGIVGGAWQGLMNIVGSIPILGTINDLIDLKDKATDAWNSIKNFNFGALIGKFHLPDVINPSGVLAAITGPFTGKSSNALKAMGKFILRNIINPGGILGAITSPFSGKSANALKSMGKFLLKMVINPAGVLAAVTAPFRGLSSDILKAIGKVALKLLVDAAGVAAAVVAPFRGLASSIVAAIGTIVPHISLPKLPHIPGLGTAVGGVFAGAQMRMIGEAGPEAVVPLNRPLGLVDPAVRALSAFAQGKLGSSEVSNNNQRSINVGGMTIITPTKDPAAVARETVNRLVASSYF